MKDVKVEILSGDIGTVRNQLNALLNEEVKEIVSLTQSAVGSMSYSIIITLIYKPINNKPNDLDYQPFTKTEQYL